MMKKEYLHIYLFIGLLFSIFFIIFFFYTKNQIVQLAIKEKEKELYNILLYHKALHKYMENVQKPVIYNLKKENKLYHEFFDSKILSFTYIARNMQKFANDIRSENNNSTYYYKLASDNPRNPLNKANKRESELLKKFNEGSSKLYKTMIQEDGKEYLYYSIPIAPNKPSCLKCHGSPKDAPIEMIKQYGEKDGFYEKVGDIRAIISLKMPLAKELNEAQGYYYKIITLVLGSVLILYFTIGYFFYVLSKKDRVIRKKNKKLEILATHDALTKVYNRLMFDRHLETLISSQSEFILVLFDIDHFKAINDHYGHDVGDKILQELTYFIQQALPNSAKLFRVGGEEFVIIFEKSELKGAIQIVEKIRQGIEQHLFTKNIKLTVSFGINSYQKDTTALELYKQADIALYNAKKLGRNQTVTYHEHLL